MARIVYAVAGEGFGHSSRSHIIGQKLIDSGHDVIFAASNKSLAYLKPFFGDRVKEVFGLKFSYHQGRVSAIKTICSNIWRSHRGLKINSKLYGECFDKFKPDLIITDFEPFSAFWALFKKVPFFSIDHQHLLTHCTPQYPPGNLWPRFNAYFVTRCYYSRAACYIILNFFKAPENIARAIVAPPVIREQASAIRPCRGEHIVVYATYPAGEKSLVKMLRKFAPVKFCVYGFNKSQQNVNITFKERSTEGFLKDTASSKGIAATAGFSLISECMHFRKKMCLFPIAGQYEQIVNAYYVEKLGLGLSRKELSEQAIEDFLTEVEKPMPDDPRILWPDNEKFFDILNERLKQLSIPIAI
ncbi:MAG: glycosyltransferase family protein [Phycisphaerae bacterium]